MGSFSVGGLSSGLDTKSIIDQLMAIESRPKTKLEWNKSLWETRKSAWSDLNTRLNSMQTFASTLTNPATWTQFSGITASDPMKLTAASSGSNPAAGTYAIEISQLAATERWESASSLTGATAGVRKSGAWLSSLGGPATAGTTMAQLRKQDGAVVGLNNNSTITMAWNQDGQSLSSTFLIPTTAGTTMGSLTTWMQGQIPGATVALNGAGEFEITAPAGTEDEITGLTLTARNSAGTVLNAFNGAAGAQTSMTTPATDGGAAADETLTITQGSNTWYVNVAEGDRETDLVNKINAVSGIGVQASISAGRLALTANASGADKSFTVTGSGALMGTLGLAESTAGVDAAFTVNGTAKTSSTNTGITSAITDVSLNLLDVTGPAVTLTVGAPGATTDDLKKKITDFVSQYNSVLDFISSKTAENKVANPKNLSEYLQGAVSRDFSMNNVAFELRKTMNDFVAGLPNGMKSLSDLGITTGAVSATYNSSNTTGKLVIDDAKLTAALNTDPSAVQDILARVGGGPVSENGIARRVSTLVSQLRTGGRVDGAMNGASAQIKSLQTSIERAADRIESKREYYERMFANLETRMGKMQAQGSWLSGQLANLTQR